MFAPHQIVCLACDQTHLYGEVIQVLKDRQMCWVRPLVLVDGQGSVDEPLADSEATNHMYPVIDGPDLLWPLNQFHIPLDTEVIPLLAEVQAIKLAEKNTRQAGNQQLRQFMERLWARQSAQ